jgi:hypothetical protein
MSGGQRNAFFCLVGFSEEMQQQETNEREANLSQPSLASTTGHGTLAWTG